MSQPVGIVLKLSILRVLGGNSSAFAKLIKKTYLGGLIKSLSALMQKKFWFWYYYSINLKKKKNFEIINIYFFTL